KQITAQEAKLTLYQKQNIKVGDLLATLIERIAFEARENEFVDSKSGVSARLTISAYENLVSTAERRMLLNNEDKTFARIVDLVGVIPSVNGKIELVYEGEQEGAAIVAQNLLGRAIRNEFLQWFPDPGKLKKKKQPSPYQSIIGWFGEGNTVDCLFLEKDKDYTKILKSIPGLSDLVDLYVPKLADPEKTVMMEFVLFALSEHSLIGKKSLERSVQFKDLLGSMFSEKDMLTGEENN
ncbi:MAG TPA: magnesium chelatase, partial [Bacteroidia bacterium]|nr:magnesium chelatase [Bacteroidia bacterium]